MPTAAYYTLGCKVNQYETEKIRETMEMRGFRTVAFECKADVYIVNTCTVTSNADSKSRKAIRSAIKSNPQSCVVVTGCYANLDTNAIGSISGVSLIVPNEEKENIPYRIIALLPDALREEAEKCAGDGTLTAKKRSRTRAVVKVQDGCDNFCTYCAVPFARSLVASRAVSEILNEIKDLAASGYKEVVLTGIRLGRFEDNGLKLPELIEKVCDIEGIERVRLSSIEPMEINSELLETVAKNRKCCRHLHVPLQSGDDEILQKMNRPYSSEEYIEMASEIKKRIPGVALTTDVMVGFPGEDDSRFMNTVRVIETVGFSRLHIFRYSPRPGTKAAVMEGQVPSSVSARRAKILGDLNRQLMETFAESQVGKTMDVLAESRKRGSLECTELTGLTDNYVETTFAGPPSLKGAVVQVRMAWAQNGKLVGELVIGGH